MQAGGVARWEWGRAVSLWSNRTLLPSSPLCQVRSARAAAASASAAAGVPSRAQPVVGSTAPRPPAAAVGASDGGGSESAEQAELRTLRAQAKVMKAHLVAAKDALIAAQARKGGLT